MNVGYLACYFSIMAENRGKFKTLRVRVKDRHVNRLRQMARSVNFVWNYVNELSNKAIRERNLYLSAFDLAKYVQGAHKELGLHCHTPKQICQHYVTSRNQFRKSRLSWRKSSGSRRSLGWIPINTGKAMWKNGAIYHAGHYFKVWDSYGLSNYEFRSASFNEDARGRWYFNVVIKADPTPSSGTSSVGIDLGCKDAVVTSNGKKLTGGWFQRIEHLLKIAQRAGKQDRARALLAKAANRRRDTLHKMSRTLVEENAAIFVGDISATYVAKTRMAKLAHDAGWNLFKTMLEHKCDIAGVVFEVVDEANTTRRCSNCLMIPDSSPKGLGALGIREWACDQCGAHHDRDVNAALNILALGHERLAGGKSALVS